MPEWQHLIWDQSTWGDGTSPQTNVLQTILGGYMPWQENQLQTGERKVEIHIYALSPLGDRDPITGILPPMHAIAEICGVDPSSSITKQIRDGVIEEQKVSLSITDPALAEYYLHGYGKTYLEEFKFIKIEQSVTAESYNLVIPLGIFRISGLPQTSDDGSGPTVTWEAEDWLASDLRTPFADGVNPYTTIINNFEGSVDINDYPPDPLTGVQDIPSAPQGISEERLALGNSIFGESSNWFHNFFGYIWNFMYDLTGGHIIVDRSVVQAAEKNSKIRVGSPAVMGLELTLAGEGDNDTSGPIDLQMEALMGGQPAQKFGIYSFPEGQSAISFLKDLISHNGLLTSHSGVRGTYFVYDRDGYLHWRCWGSIVNKEGAVFVCEGTAKGNLSLPVESLSVSIKEPEYNHFVVQGNDIPFAHEKGYIEVTILDPPPESGLNIYGELRDGFAWTETSTLSFTDDTAPITIPVGGIDHTFPFRERSGFGSPRPFNPAFTVAPEGSEIGYQFFGNTHADPISTGADVAVIKGTEIARTADDVTFHLENADTTSVEPIYLIGWNLAGTVWAPESLWDQPDQADFDERKTWEAALSAYDQSMTGELKTYQDGKLKTRWYTYPGLRDRTLFLYLGDDYVYLVTPTDASINNPPPDPRVLNGELARNAVEAKENAIKFYGGPACQVQLGIDSAIALIELGTSIRIQYPPENVDGYFQLMTINLPLNEQAQQWTLQWVEDA